MKDERRAGVDTSASFRAESSTSTDLFRLPEVLPPSTYTTPMSLKNGEPSAFLAFGHAAARSKKRSAEESAHTTAVADGTVNKKNKGQLAKKHIKLEKKWMTETQDVMGTFEAMKHELLERKRDAGLLGEGDIALSLSREYSYYDLVGSALLASVELELADVMSIIKEAEQRARTLIAIEKQEQQSSVGVTSPMDVDVPNGIGHKPAPKIDDSERDSATIQAAQDAAMMRELARIIRQRAQEMSEARLSRNSLPS